MKEVKVTKEELLDPLISHKLITSILYEGDYRKIKILSENVRLSGWNKDLLLACSKDVVPLQLNPYIHLSILFFVLGLNVLLSIVNHKIDLLFLALIIFIYKKRLPKFNTWSDEQEKERIAYIDNLLKDSGYAKDRVGL